MKFEVKQRVRVPGQSAEAVIMDATETVPGFPVYTLKYLSDAGENECGTVGEGDLHSANLTEAELTRAHQDRHDEIVCRNQMIEAEVTARVIRRLAEMAAHRRKASRRKSASKRKR